MEIMTNIYYEQLDTLDPIERELYRILKKFMANTTKKCFPSIQTLVKLLKRCKTTTKKYLKNLSEKGFIHIQHRKVTHKVTDNKFNETNQYTLLLEKFQTVKPKNELKQKNSIIELKETDLDEALIYLKNKFNIESIHAALKTMRFNIKNGTIVNSYKNYLEKLITKSTNQFSSVDKAIKDISITTEKTNSGTPKKTTTHSNNAKQVNTRFHNFEQRTSNYTPSQLESIVLNKNKKR